VYADTKGNIFSYGRHYPLLFKAKGLTFRNCVGYSNTTAKHIGWAGMADPLHIDVWVSGCNQYSWSNSENNGKIPQLLDAMRYADDTEALEQQIVDQVMTDLDAELIDINNRIASKKRTDTKIYKALLDERWDCLDRIASVRPYTTKGAK